MPFVIRKIEPRYVSRGHVPQGKASQDWPVGAELEAVANGALTASLKQLASLLTVAEDIFAELTAELTTVAERSGKLRQRLDKVEEHLSATDPKKIPVPESDMTTFALRKEHFKSWNKPVTSLFTSDTRPKALKELYEAAAIVAVKSLDSLRRDQDGSSMDMFLCTPVLGKRRRDQSLDIESRVPAAIEDLRRWTSAEALGDVTVPPDCMSRILGDTTDDSAVDHKLPSPEEQVQAVALKFPAEIVAVDISGRGFDRMSMRRRSLLSGPETQATAVKRRSRPRRPRGKRRNTIAGTDQKEIRQAIEGETTTDEPEEIAGPSRAHRSASTDILGSSKKHSLLEKKSHFNTLKAWGISRLKLISPKNSQSAQQLQQLQQLQQPEADAGLSSTDRTAEGQTFSPEETNIYETVTTRRRKDKSHERKPSSSSSSGKSTSSIPVSVPSSDKQLSVKLRESAAQRRERRKGSGRDDAPHSSSGNWSASSESGRASIGSETTTTTHQPRSTTTASIGTSSTSLCHVRRFKGRDTSASSSVTSEGTLTPDIIHDIGPVPFSDDGENSSVYSCDTEGYYTSFHMDSGLKTLREEEILPQSPLVKSCNLDSDPTSPVVENEYELFGRGSTSTTTSSAGTVCTALLAPPPPERKSSLTVVAMVHGQNKPGGESPDSGHNTSSSPVESASSPACTGRSYSEFEYSESSDLEGCDRIERIRSKTAINTSRIPSMCVITPPGSDDEHAKDRDKNKQDNNESPGSVLMSATVGTSKMEVINGQDKNLYATVQTVLPPPEKKAQVQSSTSTKISPLSGVLGKLRGVLPLTGKKNQQKANIQQLVNPDSGDYVTIADVRNNNEKHQDSTLTIRSAVTYANADLFQKDAEYVSLSELPKKPDSSLERKRQGARVMLDSEGKVVYSSDSLRRRKGAHTTFNPGPFVKEGVSPSPSPLLHRAHVNVRAVNRTNDSVDGNTRSSPPTSPQLGKVIIRAAKSPDRAASPDYIRTPSTVVSPTCPTSPHKPLRGAYVNVQGDEGKTPSDPSTDHDCTGKGRLEGTRSSADHHRPSTNVNRTRGQLLSGRGTYRPANPKTRTLTPAKIYTKPLKDNKQKTSLNNSRDAISKITRDENHPPEESKIQSESETDEVSSLVIDTPISRNQRKVLNPNSRLNFDKSLRLQNLKPSGTTPKLCRKLLVSDLDAPNFFRKPVRPSHDKENGIIVNGICKIEENASTSNNDNSFVENGDSLTPPNSVHSSFINSNSLNLDSISSKDKTETKVDRKVKRSESYRMANSPIMFIKKFANHSDKSSKIFKSPSEELQEELLKERINYPDTVSSPEPQIDKDTGFEVNLNNCPVPIIPTSPRPRALDLEPVKALQYSGNDTEIW